MAEYKIMPHNLEAEQAVLGCILIDGQAQADILGMMREEDFYSNSHREIFAVMMKIYQKSIPVDFVTLSDQLDKDNILDKVGGLEYITTLTNVVPSAANFNYYCEIVKADSIKRKLIQSGQRIIENAYESEDKESIAKIYFDKMKKNRPNDLYLKNTTSGPHRDDIEILINGISARKYGSQGQQRSASLALKLGEAEIIKELKGEHPIILLDDVMSELDSTRQNYILNKMTGKQVFITCCEKETISRLHAGKVFKIENGKAVD